MDIHQYLIQLASEQRPPSEVLQLAAVAIAVELRADRCRIYLRRGNDRLVLRVSAGATSEHAESDTAADLAKQTVTSALLSSAVLPSGAWLSAPLLSRARSLGALVVERERREDEARRFSEEEGITLSAVASQLVALVEGAELIEAIDGTVEAELPESESESTQDELTLRGAAASEGIAIGMVAFRHGFPRELVRRRASLGEPRERERLRDALQMTQNDLLRIQAAAAGELGEEQALIFAAHLLMLHDVLLLTEVEHGLKRGLSAAESVDDAFQKIAERLRNVADPYIQERAEDVEDLRSRLLGHLLEPEGPSSSLRAQLVVSSRTSPSVIMELKAQGALGLASELGGTTSHGVLLARALGVPAVTGVPNLLRLAKSGDALVIDGNQGLVILRPTPETLRDYRLRATAALQQSAEFSRFREQPPRTADDVHFALRANVALGIDLDVARENGASGVGLYRTEFAFMARDGLPSRDEQARIYAKAYRAFPDAPIAFRILDLAGDKFVSSSGVRAAQSPFHGYRSIRVLFDYPHILQTQVQAFALAAGDRPLRILVPMVSSVEDVLRIKQMVRSALEQLPNSASRPTPLIGAMIEVPAAVEIVADLAREVDFFSIGTNDLVQYALVIDREDSRMSSPRDVFHPAVLRMIRRVIQAGHAAGKEVSVCGEAAARPEFAVALLALKLDVLSVSPRAIPGLKQKLAGVRLLPLIESIDTLLDSSSAATIEQALRRVLATEEVEPPSQRALHTAGE